MPSYDVLYTMPTATQNPLSDGGSWTPYNPARPLQVINPNVEATANAFKFAADYYSGAVDFTSDQFMQFTIGALVGTYQMNLRYDVGAGKGYILQISAAHWALSNPANQTIASSSASFSPGDEILFYCLGSTIGLSQNGSVLFTGTDATSDYDGVSTIEFFYSSVPSDTSVNSFTLGSVTDGNSISGNAGVGGATVTLSGDASASTTADGSGNYSLTGINNGNYVVTPSLTGYTFSPTNRSETVSGSDITGVNFVATAIPSIWSQPDCRIHPNASRLVNGTLIYDVQKSSNPAIPPTDSREGGAPVPSGTYPQNSRTSPPFKS